MMGKGLGITLFPRKGGRGVVCGVEVGRRKKLVYTIIMQKDGSRRPVYLRDMKVLPQPRRRRAK